MATDPTKKPILDDTLLSGTIKDLTSITIYRSIVKGAPEFNDLFSDGAGVLTSKILFEGFIKDRIKDWMPTSNVSYTGYLAKWISLSGGFYTSGVLLKEGQSFKSALKDAGFITIFNVIFDSIIKK
jgi:hypothetical protein